MSEPDSDKTSEDIVAERVEELRTKAGWSYSELSRHMEAVGVPIERSSLQKIERGKPRRKIGVNELLAFAEVFNVGINELLTSTEHQRNAQFYADLRDAQPTAWNYHKGVWDYANLIDRLVEACLDAQHGAERVAAVKERLDGFRNQESITALMMNEGGEAGRDYAIQLLETVLENVSKTGKEGNDDG